MDAGALSRSTSEIGALVRPNAVHRDLYTDPAVFALERERLFQRGWLFLGHESQIPANGDFVTAEVCGRPVLVVRHTDGTIRAMMNRCAHKGTALVSERSGHVDRTFRCPYHGWAYRTDGTLVSIPARKTAYKDCGFDDCEASRGLTPVSTAVYRGFVFGRFAAEGPSFEDYAGPMTAVLDNMADRSPEGRLRIAGPPLRSLVRCNWKIYLENINDTLHALITHESSADAASRVWRTVPAGTPTPMAMEQLLPFASDFDYFEKMGGRVFPNGHSILGTRQSLHSAYGALADYEAAVIAAHGEARAREVLGFTPQNATLFPTLVMKTAPMNLRVVRPLAVDRTLVEIWSLDPIGAPDLLRQRSLTYNRLVFSPMSIVAHDDVHVWETIQRSLAADGNPWVSLHREYRGEENDRTGADISGMDERYMRNQYAAWLGLMQAPA